MKLQGKVAIVTGAARAIGRAHALRLAKLGADLVINDNDINLESYKEVGEEIGGETVVEEVRALGVRAIGIEAGVSRKAEVSGMVQQVLAELRRIYILINNAGGLAGEVMASQASVVLEKDLLATIDRNLMGTIFCCQVVAEPMKEQGWGRIVNTSSQAGIQFKMLGIYASYGATKSAIINYTKYLATELGPYNITVNCIAPAAKDWLEALDSAVKV